MEFVPIPLGKFVERVVLWLTDNYSEAFDSITAVIDVVLNQIDNLLLWLPWPVSIALFMLLAWRSAGRSTALMTGACLYFLGSFGLWEEGMSTLALVVTAVFISILMGLPLGILSARSDRAEKLMRPLLDGMQTIPSFVYLIPAVLFFGIGNVPGVLSTVIFALPPMVRLTSLGIRQVPEELIEAAQSFGSSDWQMLTKLQIPLAMPSIMAGINQTVMMALSMVVTAAMIGAGGLGGNILFAIQRVELGMGVEAGLGILFIAIVLDRILQGYSKKMREARHL
jgi:glycine betaine/proline transport system permease protein